MMGSAEILCRFAGAGLLIGLGLAWFIARGIYRAGLAAGYLDGRNFLIKRRLMLRTSVWVDGYPLEDVGSVWIETDGFDEDERRRIQQLATAGRGWIGCDN